MLRRQPRTTRTDTLFPYTTLFRSALKRHGGKHGLQWAADCIAADRRGRLCVTDPGARAAIMNLRNEPEASALMAAEPARSEERRVGKECVSTCRSGGSPNH